MAQHFCRWHVWHGLGTRSMLKGLQTMSHGLFF